MGVGYGGGETPSRSSYFPLLFYDPEGFSTKSTNQMLEHFNKACHEHEKGWSFIFFLSEFFISAGNWKKFQVVFILQKKRQRDF